MAPKSVESAEAAAIALLPTSLRAVAKEIMVDPQMNELGKLFMERAGEFPSPANAILSGIALHPPSRAHFDRHLEEMWSEKELPLPTTVVPEVIIGGGLHAAIYAAARVATGHKPPLVLEKGRPGGAFACSLGPSFYLNSRNRPGLLSVPGDPNGALNFLPGAMSQPSDLGGSEYQTNDMLAWTIRLALAMYARVVREQEVTAVEFIGSAMRCRLMSGRAILSKRVLVATGLSPRKVARKSDRLLNFAEFMARMDGPFPLRGMGRVAVVGAGDGGKTVIESLVGQGPESRSSVATLDWPERIDWYGCPQSNRRDWEGCQRSRYRGIGRFLPRQDGDEARIRVKPQAGLISTAFQSVYVDEVPYDYVIDCLGYAPGAPIVKDMAFVDYAVDLRVVAKSAGNLTRVFRIGPAAEIPVSNAEQAILNRIQENAASIFRYAGRTAALAASLS